MGWLKALNSSVRKSSAIRSVEPGECGREREAGSIAEDAAELPSTDDRVQRLVVVDEALALADRQRVDRRNSQSVAQI
jgi:hypothetical protein